MTDTPSPVNGTLLIAACAVVFALFSFIYLYCFQADLLFMVQHVLSGGATHYSRTVGALVVTLALVIVGLGVLRLGGLSAYMPAMSFFPSLLAIAALTGADAGFSGVSPLGVWVWLAPLLLAAYAAVSWLFGVFISVLPPLSTTLAGTLWKNLFALALMFLMVCLCGNADSVLHYRLRMERLLSSGDYSGALEVGARSARTDESLTMLRVYALSVERQLGQRLFEYPLAGGSRSLLPDGRGVRCLYYPESRIFRRLSIRRKGMMGTMDYLEYVDGHGLGYRPVADYALCGYLLDRDLDSFAYHVSRKYDISSPSLPKHYKEALTLYTRLRATPLVVYRDEASEADYADFQQLGSRYADKRERQTRLRDVYGDTYWYYYFYKS